MSVKRNYLTCSARKRPAVAPFVCQSFEKTNEIKAHDTYLLKCVLSPNVEKLVTTSADKTVKVWDTKTWTHQRTLVSARGGRVVGSPLSAP